MICKTSHSAIAKGNACVCLCRRAISGAGTHFLPSLQRREQKKPLSQGFERTESPSWIQKAKPFVGSRAKPLKKCEEQEINIYKKRKFVK